jgi:hypothetical protein
MESLGFDHIATCCVERKSDEDESIFNFLCMNE